jgi:hypothetical protein
MPTSKKAVDFLIFYVLKANEQYLIIQTQAYLSEIYGKPPQKSTLLLLIGPKL